jgi:hypothetical protein
MERVSRSSRRRRARASHRRSGAGALFARTLGPLPEEAGPGRAPRWRRRLALSRRTTNRARAQRGQAALAGTANAARARARLAEHDDPRVSTVRARAPARGRRAQAGRGTAARVAAGDALAEGRHRGRRAARDSAPQAPSACAFWLLRALLGRRKRCMYRRYYVVQSFNTQDCGANSRDANAGSQARSQQELTAVLTLRRSGLGAPSVTV